MKKNKLLEMAQAFAVEMIGMAKALKSLGERNIADQIERSGTSISANIAEANHPQSRLDMISKFEIALKEANETENWLSVCMRADLISETEYTLLHKR